MSPRTKRTAALAGGAAVLAFGAYTIGSQASDGVAQSRDRAAQGQAVAYGYGGGPGGPPPPGRPGGPGGPGAEDLSELAQKLGVKEADLRAAFEDIRKDQQPPPRDKRDEFAAGLAKKLGLDQSKVEAALDKLRPQGRREGHRDLTAALAKQLGLSQSKVRAALDKVRPERGNGRPDPDRFLTALAKELGVSKAKLQAAFQKVHPRPPGGPGRGPGGPGPGGPGPDAAALAKALGVDQAKLEKALDELRQEHEAEHEQRRNEFAQALADRLHIDVDKVKAALPEGPPHHGGRGRP